MCACFCFALTSLSSINRFSSRAFLFTPRARLHIREQEPCGTLTSATSTYLFIRDTHWSIHPFDVLQWILLTRRQWSSDGEGFLGRSLETPPNSRHHTTQKSAGSHEELVDDWTTFTTSEASKKGPLPKSKLMGDACRRSHQSFLHLSKTQTKEDLSSASKLPVPGQRPCRRRSRSAETAHQRHADKTQGRILPQ